MVIPFSESVLLVDIIGWNAEKISEPTKGITGNRSNGVSVGRPSIYIYWRRILSLCANYFWPWHRHLECISIILFFHTSADKVKYHSITKCTSMIGSYGTAKMSLGVIQLVWKWVILFLRTSNHRIACSCGCYPTSWWHTTSTSRFTAPVASIVYWVTKNDCWDSVENQSEHYHCSCRSLKSRMTISITRKHLTVG